jgi:flagellar hook-associated protein 3 FlgL
MRVTFNSSFSQSSHDLTRATEELARRQREVSSGRSLNVASDNPSAAAASVRERADLAALAQYQQTADNVTARLMVIDSALSDTILRLTDAQTAILGARGSAVTDAQRQAAANDLIGIRDAIYSNLNTSFRGTYLFGGSSGTQAPFVKAATGAVTMTAFDGTPLVVDIGRHVSVQMSYDGRDIAQGTAAESVFEALDRAIVAVRSGNDPDMASAAASLQAAFDRTTAVQSHVGTAMNVIEGQLGRVRELKLAGEGRVADHEGVNLAEAISKMNQADTAYRASLGAIGASGRTTLMDYLR